MGLAAMGMADLTDVDRHHVQFAMAYTAFGHDGVGRIPHNIDWSPHYRYLQAIVMIQMDMHAGEGKFMMIMVHLGNSARQLQFMMVVHVTEGGNAITITGFF